MDSVDRLLGKLEAQHNDLKTRLFLIEKKIDGLTAFKWKMIGGSAVVSMLLSIIVEYIIFH